MYKYLICLVLVCFAFVFINKCSTPNLSKVLSKPYYRKFVGKDYQLLKDGNVIKRNILPYGIFKESDSRYKNLKKVYEVASILDLSSVLPESYNVVYFMITVIH